MADSDSHLTGSVGTESAFKSKRCDDSYRMIANLIGPAKIVCAPMVLGSELAFRMLVRRHGIRLCYTPMLKAEKLIARDPDEIRILETCREDRPLVAQFCGRDPEVLAQAIHVVLETMAVDAVDLNLGCPQECAQLGGYGAFLQDEPDVAKACVEAMAEAAAPLPVFCKTRLLESKEKSIAFAQCLEEAGCSALALHCRQRSAKHHGKPDFLQLADVISAVSIPVIANGGINSVEFGHQVIEDTGAVAVMSASALLSVPNLFSTQRSDVAHPVDLALEYLEFAERHPPPSALYVRKHLRWIFRSELEAPYIAAMRQCLGVERPSDWANVCHAYFAKGRCKFGEACRWRHEHNAHHASSGKESRASRSHNSEPLRGIEDEPTWDWRVRAWTFLVRPYLEELCQFVDVVRLIAHHLQWQLPGHLQTAANRVPTFREIRAGRATAAACGDQDEGVCLDWLF